MDACRFDRIAQHFANRRLSSRQALAAGGTALAATGLSTAGLSVSAQDATPQATPAATGEKITYLFVQSFQSGSIAPTVGQDGRYTVTLEQGLGQTIYFADRPSRDVGVSPTGEFLQGLGFTEENPPNAALLLAVEGGETDIAVVELFNPTYDEETHTATYDVAVLESWQDDLDLGLQDTPADLATLAPTFGAAHLLIDDCLAGTVQCFSSDDGYVNDYENLDLCYNYAICMPCEPYYHSQPDTCSTVNYWGAKCTTDNPGQCGSACYATFSGSLFLGCTD